MDDPVEVPGLLTTLTDFATDLAVRVAGDMHELHESGDGDPLR